MFRYPVFALSMSLILTAPAFAGWTPPTPVVTATTVGKGEIQQGLKIPGSFVALNTVVIRAKIRGEVLEILFKDGDAVKEGKPLFQLRDSEEKALLQKAEAVLKRLSAQLRRSKELSERGFLSQSNMDKITSDTTQATAQVSIAKEELAKTKVTAPFEGVLSTREVSVGAYVQEYDPLVTLQNLDPVRFEFQVPVQKLALIQDEQPVKVSTDVYPGRVFEGKIVVVEPRADEKTRNVKVLAEFSNEKNELIPGMFGNVSILTADQHEGLLIPEEALVVRRDGLYVYKVEPDVKDSATKDEAKVSAKAGDKPEETTQEKTKAKLTKITVGTRSNDQVEILSGLTEGDEIVLQGQDKINDNADIEVHKPQS